MGATTDSVKLADFVPSTGADGWAYDTDFLATLKVNGNKDHEYGYLSPYWAAQYFKADQAGWYDLSVCQDEEFDDAEKKDSFVVPAGQSFLVYTSGADIELLVPSPLN